MRRLAGLVGIAFLLTTTGCGGATRADGRTVVAAFYPLAWVAAEVGGPSVRVVDLTPSGAEPHDLELTPGDIRTIDDARLVLYLGGGFQPAVEKAVQGRSGPSVDLLAGQKLLPDSAQGGGAEAAPDPHVWLDPTRLAAMAAAVGRELHRPRAAARLAGRLRALDGRMKTGLAACRRREIVTSHAAFGYLAARYGLEQLALTGLSPEAEPSPRDLERLVQEVERSHATTVFFETLVSPKLAQTIAREADVKTAALDPLEGLTAEEAAAGESYLSIMGSNLATLRKALGCR